MTFCSLLLTHKRVTSILHPQTITRNAPIEWFLINRYLSLSDFLGISKVLLSQFAEFIVWKENKWTKSGERKSQNVYEAKRRINIVRKNYWWLKIFHHRTKHTLSKKIKEINILIHDFSVEKSQLKEKGEKKVDHISRRNKFNESFLI